jgi:hypothetical protein
MVLLERARATLRSRLGDRAPSELPRGEAIALLDVALLAGEGEAVSALRAALAPSAVAPPPPPPPPAPTPAPAPAPEPPPPPPPPSALRANIVELRRALLQRPGGVAARSPSPATSRERRRSELLRDVFALISELREGGSAMNDALQAGNAELDDTGAAVEGNVEAVARANAALQREDARAWRHACALCAWVTWAVLAFFAAYVAIRVLPRPPRLPSAAAGASAAPLGAVGATFTVAAPLPPLVDGGFEAVAVEGAEEDIVEAPPRADGSGAGEGGGGGGAGRGAAADAEIRRVLAALGVKDKEL